jgi:hypothetical protein
MQKNTETQQNNQQTVTAVGPRRTGPANWHMRHMQVREVHVPVRGDGNKERAGNIGKLGSRRARWDGT